KVAQLHGNEGAREVRYRTPSRRGIEQLRPLREGERTLQRAAVIGARDRVGETQPAARPRDVLKSRRSDEGRSHRAQRDRYGPPSCATYCPHPNLRVQPDTIPVLT